MTFTPSPEQAAFFSEVQSTSSNILLQASAGSGKTTTIEQLLKLPWMAGKKSLVLAFNKDIEIELRKRMPLSAQVSTFSALGLAAWKTKMFPQKVEVEVGGYGKDNKLKRIAKVVIPKYDFQYQQPTCKVVEWAKSFGVGIFSPGNETDFKDLILHFDENLEVESEEKLIFYCVQMLRVSNSDLTRIDFADMLYFPLLHSLRWPKYNFVIIDEAQDTNRVQRELLKSIATSPSRLLAVGDPFQAIYGFRGADANALNAMTEEFGMIVMPLAVSYRCSQEVVKEAQRISKQKVIEPETFSDTIANDELQDNLDHLNS